ncbi:hypothetical protein [Xanthomonas sp. NCPPB 2632]|uniref:hypothetical protein n=1 Tax=Xanthomonas sp. NCPPB 2632 TaxID=3240912 RepID=UPI00351121DC
MEFVIALVIFELVCIVLCVHLARRKFANVVFWGAMGAVFGPLALIALLLSRRDDDL